MNRTEIAATELSFLDQAKLKSYFFIEGLVKDRLAGQKDPWPKRFKLTSTILLTLGLFGIGAHALVEALRPQPIDVCINPNRLFTDTFERVYAPLEPPKVFAAEEFGGGPSDTLDSYNAIATENNIGFYSQTNLRIELTPDSIHSVLNAETIGANIPDSMQLIYSLANVAFTTTEYGKSFTDSTKAPVVESIIPAMKARGHAPNSGEYIFIAVPLYDVFNRTLVNNPNITSPAELRTHLSNEIMYEIRLITASALMDQGFVKKIPDLDSNIKRQMNFSDLRVSQIPVNFIDLACQSRARNQD